MVMTAALTWIVPGGAYDREILTDASGNDREVVKEGTYHEVQSQPRDLFALVQSPVKGIQQTADIIGFILIIGGVFAVIQKTGVITAAIHQLVRKLHNREKIVIPAGILLFSIFGAVFGMSEEVIPFVLIFIPLSIALGYDSIVGVSIPFLGAGLGFAGAMMNPFTLGIAQGIAGLPLFSGFFYRIAVWAVVTGAGIWMIMRYAARVKKEPRSSLVYDLDRKRKENTILNEGEITFDWRHKLILILFLSMIVLMVFGVMRYGWFIAEIAGLFLAVGIISGIIGRLSPNAMAESFIDGARDLVGAALIVGFARAILVLATDGQIIDTVMYALSRAIRRLHPVFAAQSMFGIQTVLNFFVPSGSGKAALTMPIMAPLADLIGITRQTSVLAYQLGDGLTNMIIPTSGVTMGVLGMAKIPWSRWARWLLPLEIILFIIGLMLLIPPVLFNWGPT
jgi:uncharacterized ion transporter superfamily protein YfcC